MMLTEISISVTLILTIFCSPSHTIEYFIYMPNTIISQSILNVPVYISRPPAIISFTTILKTNHTQSFMLTKTFSEVPVRLFHVERYLLAANIAIKLYSCKNRISCYQKQMSKLLLEKTYKIPISQKTHLIIVFPSKLCYKLKEKLQIHVFFTRIHDLLNGHQIYNSSLLWEKEKLTERPYTLSQFLKIDLYDGRNTKVADWSVDSTNITSVLEHRLEKNASTGIWRIEYYFPGKFQSDYEEFKVISEGKDSVFEDSKINVTIEYHDDITINSKEVQFSLCAGYSRIRSVIGKFSGTICLKNVDEELSNERPCLKFAGLFNGSSKCVAITSKTDDLDLKNGTYVQQLNRLIISVNVVDDSSKKSHFFRYIGPVLENSKYKIVFLSNHYFKSMLPYYGKIKTLMHNGKPFPNASVTIQCNTVNFLFNWGHISKHVSDQEGLIYFILSPPPNQLSVITCDIEDSSSIEETYGTLKYYRPSITQTLEKWKSESTNNIQLKFLGRTTSLGSTEELKLELQSNELITEDLVMLLVGNGQIIKSRYIENKELPKKTCYNRDDELGHYTCDPKSNAIKCMKKWKGENCLSPICQGNCNYGICVDGNVCFCKYGWTGELCDKCLPSKSCINGYCIEGNDCVCRPGWIGSNCDIEGTETLQIKQVKGKVFQRSARPSNTKHIKNSLIFTININWSIPLMITRLSVMVYTVSKIPSSSELFLSPSNVQLDSLETNDINLIKNFPLDSVKCINIHPRSSMEHLIDSLVTIDSLQVPLQTSLYNMIIFDQCTMPFQNFDKITSNQLNSNMMGDFTQIEHHDFLNMVKVINLFPISTMKVVSRTCPMWKILADYNKLKNPSTEKPKRTTVKSLTTTNVMHTSKFCGCNGECGRYVFSDFQQVPQFEGSAMFSSICTNTTHSGNKSVFIKNQNIKIHTPFLVTISTIRNIKIQEIHNQQIKIFNKIDSDLEIEITASTKSHCFNDLLPERTIVFVKAYQSVTVIQNMQFNCSGVFQVSLVFRASKKSKIYPNMMDEDTDPIVRTESVIYNVITGIYQSKVYDYQFCQTKTQNTSVELALNDDFQSKNLVEFEVNIQNSLETLLEYVRYIYNNPKLENIFALTMKIYEMNLNKLLKNKKYVNQSLINIKRMVQVESEILRNITRSLTLEYEVSLINLCSDIPNLLYSVKRQFCKLIRNKIKMSKFNSNNCLYFQKRLNEAILMMSIVLSEPTPFTLQIFKEKLSFIKSCFANANHSLDWVLYRDLIKKSEKDCLSIEKWITAEKDFLTFSQLSFTYFILKDKPELQSVLSKIIKILIHKINQKSTAISQIDILLLFKLFTDFEERFQPNTNQERFIQNSKFSKSFSSWSRNQKLEIDLPRLHACLNIKVKVSYYSSTITTPQNRNDFHEIIVKQPKENCHTADISLIFNKEIMNYKSLMVLLPTGWILTKPNFQSLLVQTSLCNIVVNPDHDHLTIHFDFYLALKNCKLKTLVFKLTQYQQISNIRPSFTIISTKHDQIFYIPFQMENCHRNSSGNKANKNSKNSPNTIDRYLLKGSQITHEIINIKTTKKTISIDANWKIVVLKKNEVDSNKIYISNQKGETVKMPMNAKVLWFLQNYYHNLSTIGKVISNVLFSNPFDIDLLIPKDIPYCLPVSGKRPFNDYFFQIICKNLTHHYIIKSIDLNKNIITLQELSDNCNLNSKSMKEFKMNVIIKESFVHHCKMLWSTPKTSKNNPILFSPRNLKEISPDRGMNLNNDFLIIS